MRNNGYLFITAGMMSCTLLGKHNNLTIILVPLFDIDLDELSSDAIDPLPLAINRWPFLSHNNTCNFRSHIPSQNSRSSSTNLPFFHPLIFKNPKLQIILHKKNTYPQTKQLANRTDQFSRSIACVAYTLGKAFDTSG